MHSNNDDHYSSSEGSLVGQGKIVEFSAPLGSLENARLFVASQARWLELNADPSISALYHARFWRYVPHLRVQENAIILAYQHDNSLEHLDDSHGALAEIGLNASIPWEIEFHTDVSQLNADLRRLKLCSLDILGHADQIRLNLSNAVGTAYLYISGGIHQSSIHLPTGAGLRVQVSGGATNLMFDNQHLGSLTDETRLESSNFDDAACRYDICISGGARDLIIDRQALGSD